MIALCCIITPVDGKKIKERIQSCERTNKI